MKYLALVCCLVCLPLMALAELPLGEVPKTITLSGDLGGRLDGTAWSSDELRGKIYTLWYVDPDESELNNHATERLKKEEFPLEQVGSVAIVNMAATWKPNFAISSVLKDKQEEFPTTIYVKDYDSVLVKEWGLDDDNSDVVAFDQEGRVIFSKDGKLSDEEVEQLVQAIKDNLPE